MEHVPPAQPAHGHPANLAEQTPAALQPQLNAFCAEMGRCVVNLHRRITEIQVADPVPAGKSEPCSPGTSGQPAIDTSSLPGTRLAGTFNETFPLDAYLAQFDIVVRCNGWNAQPRFCAVASQLHGPAIELLATLPQSTATTGEYQVLLNALEALFGEHHLQFCNHSELRNRRQHLKEPLQELAVDVERLAQKAFCGSPCGIRDTAGLAAFVDAIGEGNIQRLVRMARPTTVRLALAMALEAQIVEVSLNIA